MSEVRKIEVDIDIDLMQEVAVKKLGWRAAQKVTMLVYRTPVDCDLVVTDGSDQIGFRKTKNGKVEAVVDSGSSAERKLRLIMPLYKEHLAIKRSSMVGFKVAGRVETDREIILKLRR